MTASLTSRVHLHAKTGIAGLDHVLRGGLTTNRLYLVEGVPGSGKTTLALQFLLEGVRAGESALYATLSETEEELEQVAASHGWSLEGIAVREMVPTASSLRDEQYTMFHPSEVELHETTKSLLEDVERTRPARLVFDSLSELRLLAGNALRYRRQILALKQFFSGQNCTVLLLDDLVSGPQDLQVQSIAHGVVRLEQLNPEFGAERRRLQVVKFRGVGFRGGYHDYVIRHGGLQVFPAFLAGQPPPQAVRSETLESGIPGLDSLLGGGIEYGTSTLIVGAAGCGKSSVATRFAWSAARHGRRAVLFLFDESPSTLLARSASFGMDLGPDIEAGRIALQPVSPGELSPGEFGQSIRQAVEDQDAAVVVLDSLNGYLHAMPEERFLVLQLHEFLTYLGQRGVATILIGAHPGLVGGPMTTPVDASYLADGVVLMRYFELGGEVRQALSVLKKRSGRHERTIRQLHMDAGGIRVGEPLRDFRGVLTGVPIFEASAPSMEGGDV